MQTLLLFPLMVLILYWAGLIFFDISPRLDILVEYFFRDFASYEPIFIVSRFITELGSKYFLIPLVLVMMVVFYFMYRSIIPSIFLGAGTLLAHVINVLLKEIFQRERPFIWVEASGYGYSFPSGHSMISLVCYGLLAYFLSLKIKDEKHKGQLFLFFGGLVLLIGVSRFVLNVHYPSDIISGFLIGYLLLLAYLDLAKRWRRLYE